MTCLVRFEVLGRSQRCRAPSRTPSLCRSHRDPSGWKDRCGASTILCGEATHDPWHHVPMLARKPGALRNGAPFKDWLLPAARSCSRFCGISRNPDKPLSCLAYPEAGQRSEGVLSSPNSLSTPSTSRPEKAKSVTMVRHEHAA